ncbi:MAG: hypothetical protein MN733_27095 [Nitrososphaera sp.]|nr:hypothetical protein [Nitrososphaera sp.]
METEHSFQEELVVFPDKPAYHVEGCVRPWNPLKGFEDQCPKGLVCEVRCVETNTVTWASTKVVALARMRFAVKMDLWFRSDEAEPYRKNKALLAELWSKDPDYTYAGVTKEDLLAINTDGGFGMVNPHVFSQKQNA